MVFEESVVKDLVGRPQEAGVQVVGESGLEPERDADVGLQRLDLVGPERRDEEVLTLLEGGFVARRPGQPRVGCRVGVAGTTRKCAPPVSGGKG